jgi:tRNA A-37 threonylcarbamoyl transferase component Bud32
MKTHCGNSGKVLNDIGKITFDTLDKYGIEYDEIYFGKPYADFYIDDSSINPLSDDVEKEIGYYMNSIKPRSTNSIEYQDNIVIKKGECVLSEIYYYKNIVKEIKYIFPVLYSYDKEEKIMNIEKINGVNVSHLFINELLTEYTFKVILNTIDRIHKFETIDDINIYENYTSKVKKRYDESIYRRYCKSSNDMYEEIICTLDKYEMNKRGIKRLIHGDPVFTNIIVNENEKIKLLDPRGKIGEMHTIYGDCNYDRAKILQSLIGYDEVLQDKYVNEEYRNIFLRIFKERYDNYEEIAVITKSLLFSLIPLHEESKRAKFYELINSKYL